MESNIASKQPVGVPRRLNPFAFPVETDARFRLLVASAIALTFAMSFQLSGRFGWFFPGGVLCLFVGLTIYYFRRHPTQIRREKELVPADAHRDAAFLTAVAEVAADVGITPPPRIELGPAKAQDGQAFGFANQPILRLGNGLRILRLKNPVFFRTIVLHELAHLMNQDVQRTYWTQALWQSFLLVMGVLAPLYGFHYLLNFVVQEIWLIYAIPTALFMAILIGFRIALVVLLVAFIRRGVLKVREYYADWRAALCGAEAGMLQILQQPRTVPKLSRWQRLTSFHPSASDRYSVLINPVPLFRINRELPITAAVLMGIIFSVALRWFGWFYLALDVRGTGAYSLLAWLVTLVAFGLLFFFTSLLIDTVGLQVLRESVANLVQNQLAFSGFGRLLMPSFLMAIGFQLGPILTPFDPFNAARPQRQFAFTAEEILSITLTFLVTQLLLTFTLTLVHWLGLAMIRLLVQPALQQASNAETFREYLRNALLGPRLWFCCTYVLVLSTRLTLNEQLTLSEWLIIAIVMLLLNISLLLFIGLRLAIHRLTTKPSCSKCGEKVDLQSFLTKECHVCGYDNGGWLFVDPLPRNA